MKHLLLQLGLTALVTAGPNLATGPNDSGIGVRSSATTPKENWGPENGWSYRELTLFEMGPLVFTAFEFNDGYHFNRNWYSNLDGNTITIGNRSLAIDNNCITLTTDINISSDIYENLYCHPYISNKGFKPVSQIYSFEYLNDRLVTVKNGADTVTAYSYDSEGNLDYAYFSSLENDASHFYVKTEGKQVTIAELNNSNIADSTFILLDDENRIVKNLNVSDGDTTSIETIEFYNDGSFTVKESHTYVDSYSFDTLYESYSYKYTYNQSGILTHWEMEMYAVDGTPNMAFKGTDELNDDNTIALQYASKKDSGLWNEYYRLSVIKDDNNNVIEVDHLYDWVGPEHTKTRYTYYPNGWPSSKEILTLQDDGTWEQTSLDSIYYSSEPTSIATTQLSSVKNISMKIDGHKVTWDISSTAGTSKLSIFTISGRKIGEVDSNNGRYEFNTASLSSGVYLYQVDSFQGKFMVE